MPVGPTLPTELLLPIIILALPSHVGFSTRQQRTSLLLNLSRVSRAFHGICTSLLYSHVFLSTAACAERFVALLEASAAAAAKERAGFVRSLWLGAEPRREGAFGDPKQAINVLRWCRGAQKLYLSCIDDFDATALELPKDLEHLHLHYIELTTPPADSPPPTLPSLARLNVVNDHSANHTSLLNPTSLPSLTHLSLPTYYFTTTDLTRLESLAPNLTTLLLGRLLFAPEVLAATAALLTRFLTFCTQLQTLSLSTLSTLSVSCFLLPLPRPLHTLRILSSFATPKALEGLAYDALRALQRTDCLALSDLKRLWLPKPWDGMFEGWGEKGRRELAEVCAQGVELRWYEWERKEGRVVSETWEGYLEDLV